MKTTANDIVFDGIHNALLRQEFMPTPEEIQRAAADEALRRALSAEPLEFLPHALESRSMVPERV